MIQPHTLQSRAPTERHRILQCTRLVTFRVFLVSKGAHNTSTFNARIIYYAITAHYKLYHLNMHGCEKHAKNAMQCPR